MVVEGDGEVDLLIEDFIDSVLVVVDDVEEVVLGGLPGVDHVQVLHLTEDRLQFLVLPL